MSADDIQFNPLPTSPIAAVASGNDRADEACPCPDLSVRSLPHSAPVCGSGTAILNAAEEAREGAAMMGADIIDLSALARIEGASGFAAADIMPVIGTQDSALAQQVVSQTWPLVQANIATVRAVADHTLKHRPEALARVHRSLDEAEDAFRAAVRAHNNALAPVHQAGSVQQAASAS